MNNLAERIASLSPRQRQLLALKLQRQGADGNSIVALPRAQGPNRFPLSFAQQRLWFLEQLDPGSPAYNIPLGLRLKGEFQFGAIKQALNEMVRRHESLRTTFPSEDGIPVQEIAPSTEIPLPVLDLSAEPAADIRKQVEQLAYQEARRPFDLAAGPLFRVTLVKGRDEHYLLGNQHHIISDLASMRIFIKELGALYEAYSTGQSSPLADLSIQYADYAAWQRHWLQGETLEAHRGFWREYLGGSPPALELPTDHLRPPVPSRRGAMRPIEIPQPLTEALKALAQREAVTPFMLLLAALKTLLFRYTGEDDLLIGVPFANRNRIEVEAIIGLFVNTLVLRTSLAGNPSFLELLSRVRQSTLGAYAHHDLPFEYVIEIVQPERNLDRSPLFQVMFELHSGTMQPPPLSSVASERIEMDTGAAKLDLLLDMTDTGPHFNGYLEYNTDVFEPETIDRIIAQYTALLEGIAASPQSRLLELPLLSAQEQDRLLADAAQAEEGVEEWESIKQVIEAQAARRPDAIVASHGPLHLSFAQLNARANQLALHLIDAGLQPGQPVGLLLPHSLDLLVAVFAVFKAGACYIGLDPTLPQRRLRASLADAQARFLLTHSDLLDLVGQGDWHPFALDRFDWHDSAAPLPNPLSPACPDSLAYLLFTSGSTGQAKPVAIPQAALANYLTWAARSYSISADDAFALFTSLAFDLTVTSLLLPLLAGCRLFIYEQGLDGLAALLSDARVTLIKATPSHLKAILDADPPANPQLRALILGGEALEVELVHRLHRQLGPHIAIFNEYGPTEATVGCMLKRFDDSQAHRHHVSLGRPAKNMRVHVLDPQQGRLGDGLRGELFIGGRGLAHGYLGRPAETAAAYLPDSLSGLSGQRLYRSGDFGRTRSGEIDYLGRADGQVKFRGHRLELGEVESLLNQHPGVSAAAVLVSEDESKAQHLVAYVALKSEMPDPGREMRKHLAAGLPDYVVPKTFIVLDKLPLTANGKVDRKALPRPDFTKTSLHEAFVAPRNAVESLLTDIWKQVLRLDSIGVHDNFFEIGGDSIISIQVVTKANQAGLRLTPRKLFQHPTIATLAEVATSDSNFEAEQGVITGPLPLTPIQHWFFEHHFAEAHHWNQSILLEVDRGLEFSVLQTAVRGLLEHHDALRLRFVRNASGWQQFNADLGEGLPVVYVDLSTFSPPEQSRAIEARSAELQASLDLAAGPLVRLALFDCGPQQAARLLFIVHHLVTDGVSWRILLEDLQTALLQAEGARPIRLPLKTMSYKRWAESLTEYARSATLQQELGHWQKAASTPLRRLPLDFSDGENTVESARTVSVALDQEETRALLKEVPKVYHTQINDVLLTGLARAIYSWIGAGTLLVDLEGHGREEIIEGIDLTRTVGWFTALYPITLELGSAPAAGPQLESVKAQLRQIPQQGMGYGVLRYLSTDPSVARQMRALPQAQVVFNYQGDQDQGASEPSRFRKSSLATGPARSLRGHRAYVIEINSGVNNAAMQFNISYSARLHQQSTITQLAQGLVGEVRSLISHCLSAGGASYSPADFPLAQLSQRKLNNLTKNFGKS